MKLVFLSLGVLFAAWACQPATEGGGATPLVASLSELKPDATPGDSALLMIGPVKNVVEIQAERSGEDFTLDLVAHGEVFETETYKVGKDAFYLVEAADDAFDPPVPLLMFPLYVNTTRVYQGQLKAGGSHKVMGKIKTTLDKVFMPTQEEAVRVDLELSMDSGGPNPAERKLSFWFVKDRGLVKREFGNGLSREPDLELPEPQMQERKVRE